MHTLTQLVKNPELATEFVVKQKREIFDKSIAHFSEKTVRDLASNEVYATYAKAVELEILSWEQALILLTYFD